MKIINLYGGPGVGKSTLAAKLFAHMKENGYDVELVTEYAKQLTWEGRTNALSNQVYVFGKQLHNFHRLAGKVDYVITDSPLLLTLAYKPDHLGFSFDNMVIDVIREYQSIHLYLERHTNYQPNGRNQTQEEAINVDVRIKTIMDYYRLAYHSIDPLSYTGQQLEEVIKAEAASAPTSFPGFRKG